MASGPSDTGARPVFPRSAVILLMLGGATLAAFGLAAVSGIFTPAFLAFVLTLCVHPVSRWLQAHGIPRGIATGGSIAAVFILLAGFAGALIAALAQFLALLPQFAPQIAAAGASISQQPGGGPGHRPHPAHPDGGGRFPDTGAAEPSEGPPPGTGCRAGGLCLLGLTKRSITRGTSYTTSVGT
ncbi:hypothetical protein QNO00_01010 [Arthrobacter sp. zg-Y1219]|uniref:AI-2E family transporter n=1 Tax=Arthrobacter sp. zg-Y1219 TaxID=3049067 RepID=UPI0024C37DA8|nr:hypothetical protein [Arthrobacter sp. zg-Y1219]MDK1358847.1 hypothetical protein [Arthrobacter sp. zg-Y1219]